MFNLFDSNQVNSLEQALYAAHRGYGAIEISTAGIPDGIMNRIIRLYINQQYVLARDKTQNTFHMQWASEMPLASFLQSEDQLTRPGQQCLTDEADWIVHPQNGFIWTRFGKFDSIDTSVPPVQSGGILPPAVQQAIDEFTEQLVKESIEQERKQVLDGQQTDQPQQQTANPLPVLTRLLTSQNTVYDLIAKKTVPFDANEYVQQYKHV